jgi:hypothetical protein
MRRAELDPVLELAKSLPVPQLTEFLGELETVRIVALTRILSPAASLSPDRLIGVSELAERLHVHSDFVYRHQSQYKEFAKPQGSKLLWSSNGLDSYLKNHK